MKISKVSYALKWTLYIVFALGVVLVVTAPFLLEDYMRVVFRLRITPAYRSFIVPFLMVESSFGLWIVGELIGMLHTVSSQPFIWKNVTALRRMGVAGLLAAVAFFAKCFWLLTPLTLVCGFVLTICSMGAFTLSDLFRQAVIYREENDLTI